MCSFDSSVKCACGAVCRCAATQAEMAKSTTEGNFGKLRTHHNMELQALNDPGAPTSGSSTSAAISLRTGAQAKDAGLDATDLLTPDQQQPRQKLRIPRGWRSRDRSASTASHAQTAQSAAPPSRAAVQEPEMPQGTTSHAPAFMRTARSLAAPSSPDIKDDLFKTARMCAELLARAWAGSSTLSNFESEESLRVAMLEKMLVVSRPEVYEE